MKRVGEAKPPRPPRPENHIHVNKPIHLFIFCPTSSAFQEVVNNKVGGAEGEGRVLSLWAIFKGQDICKGQAKNGIPIAMNPP
jgi:hypothetical protein